MSLGRASKPPRTLQSALQSSLASLALFTALLLTVTGSFCSAAQASNSQTSSAELFSYTVFAKESITSLSSDFQGATGAGGDVRLTDFFIKSNLFSSSNVLMNRGAVGGTVLAKSVRLSNAQARASRVSASYAPIARMVSDEADSVSMMTSNLPATAQVATDDMGLLVRTSGMTVANLSSAALAGGKNLTIEGATQDTLVLNITGTTVDWIRSGVFIRGGISPEHILFNFPDATELSIAFTGGPSYGVPGTVLAPNARFHFVKALVTGAVFVRSIDTNVPALSSVGNGTAASGLRGGQVNASCFKAKEIEIGCGISLPPPPQPVPTT